MGSARALACRDWRLASRTRLRSNKLESARRRFPHARARALPLPNPATLLPQITSLAAPQSKDPEQLHSRVLEEGTERFVVKAKGCRAMERVPRGHCSRPPTRPFGLDA